MPESKIEITHRLQRDGRWAEATEFRDRVRRELRQAGKTKAEANDDAWRRMSEQFPPVVAAQAQQGQRGDDLDSEDDDNLPTNLAPSDGDFDADITWAWNNLGDAVRPEDAPNGSAWCLRMFGVEEFDKFVRIVAKSIGMGKKNMAAQRMREDRDRQFALLASLAAGFEREKELVPQGAVGTATAGF